RPPRRDLVRDQARQLKVGHRGRHRRKRPRPNPAREESGVPPPGQPLHLDRHPDLRQDHRPHLSPGHGRQDAPVTHNAPPPQGGRDLPRRRSRPPIFLPQHPPRALRSMHPPNRKEPTCPSPHATAPSSATTRTGTTPSPGGNL